MPLCLFSVMPAKADPYLHTNMKCVSPTERREILLYLDGEDEPNDFACRLDYIKYGERSTLWRAQQNESFCEEKMTELVSSLKNVGFKCVPTPTASEEEER